MTLIISLLIIFFDQIAKNYVVATMDPGQSFPVLKNIFHITAVHNSGAAFGIFPNAALFFIFVSAGTIIIIGYGLLVMNKANIQISLALILGGAIGNLIDRLRFGFVVDFLDFRIWPVFNIADAAITIGTGLLILQTIRRRK